MHRQHAAAFRVIVVLAALILMAAGLFPSAFASQIPAPGATPMAAGFRLVARVASDDWPRLETTAATPSVNEERAAASLPDALRESGFVMYFRHARTDFSQDDTDLSDLTNCTTQRNLSREGRAQAAMIGDAMRALDIPIGEVLSSELCRTRETAELAFGRVTLEPMLTSFGTATSEAEEQQRVEALRLLLSTQPEPGTNTVLVGHLFNIQAATGIGLAEGEAAIFLPLEDPASGQ